MFNHGKFNLKRFNLPGEGSAEITFRDQFASAFEALADIGEDIYIDEKHAAEVKGAVVFASLVDASGRLSEALSGGASLRCNAVLSGQLADGFSGRVFLSIDSRIITTLYGQVKAAAALGEDIIVEPEITGIVKAAAALGAKYTSGEISFSETVNSIIATAIFDTVTLRLDLSIPAGGKVVIDSDNYNVLFNGENAIDKHSGEWLFLSRAVDRITFRPYGSNVAISVLYTERYL